MSHRTALCFIVWAAGFTEYGRKHKSHPTSI